MSSRSDKTCLCVLQNYLMDSHEHLSMLHVYIHIQRECFYLLIPWSLEHDFKTGLWGWNHDYEEGMISHKIKYNKNKYDWLMWWSISV